MSIKKFKSVDQVRAEDRAKGYELPEFIPGHHVILEEDGAISRGYCWQDFEHASENVQYLPKSIVDISVVSPDDSGIWVRINLVPDYDD